MIFTILLFLIGSVVLGLAWLLFFWLVTLMVCLVSVLAACLGVSIDISEDRNLYVLFAAICLLSLYVYTAAGDAGLAAGWVVFITGAFSLATSMDNWRISP